MLDVGFLKKTGGTRNCKRWSKKVVVRLVETATVQVTMTEKILLNRVFKFVQILEFCLLGTCGKKSIKKTLQYMMSILHEVKD